MNVVEHRLATVASKLATVASETTARSDAASVCPTSPELPACANGGGTDTLLGWAVVLLAAALCYALNELMSIHNHQKASTRDASTQCSEDAETLRAAAAMRGLRRMLVERGVSDETMPDETRRLQALQATQMNVQVACERLLATEKWRAERALLQEGASLNNSLHGGSPHAPAATRVAVRGRDKLGRPCLHVSLGDAPSTLPDEVLSVLDAHFERVRNAGEGEGGAGNGNGSAHASGGRNGGRNGGGDGPSGLVLALPPSQQLCVILDLSDLELTTLLRPPIGTGVELVKQLRAHYPQRLSHLHIVHAPAVARWLVATICSILDSRTAKKVFVHDEAGLSLASSLTDHFAVDQLPQRYGGTLAPERSARRDRPSRERSAGGAQRSAGGSGSNGNGNGRNGTGGDAAVGAPSAPAAAPPAAPSAAAPPAPRPGSGLRHVWSVLSEREAAEVKRLREAGVADPEIRAADYPNMDDEEAWPDDEMIRFLCDTEPALNQEEGLVNVRAAAKMRATMLARPIPGEAIAAMHHVARFDGTTKDGERALFVCMSRPLQDALLKDPEPFLNALIGLMGNARKECFRKGEMETVQTVVMVERGFALKLPVAAGQRVMQVITNLWPSFTSKILVVNLPGYLSWFVGFVKGFLCEASQQKIELISSFDRLLDFYEREQLPTYFRERGSITP
jgi:uncharacterized membrane protein YgcG